MGFFDKFKKEKEVWRMCISLKYPCGIVVGAGSRKEQEGQLYYHLFESNLGNRRVQARASAEVSQAATDKFAKSTDFYHQKIYRWLAGRNDPDIPRFTEIDAAETMHYLKGTIKEDLQDK